MKYDFSSLEKAQETLKDILKQPLNEYIRDGAIQRFEYTFELSWKFLQRVLKDQGQVTGSPQQVLRSAHQAGLIDQLDTWFEFLKSRNLSVHTYDQRVANEVFESAKKFPPFVDKLLNTLKKLP